jgi:hypothetical protein
MIRLLGFIIGSAVSIGAILLIFGVPEFRLSNPHLDKARFDEAVQNLKDKQREVASVVASAAEAVAPEATASAKPEELPPAEVASTVEQPEIESEVAQDDSDTFALPQEQHWHSFWNPFRSEIAARGFVSQLERVTGLDYRIVKVKTGVYEVAFAYEGDIEKQAKLSQIQAATGLELPGS